MLENALALLLSYTNKLLKQAGALGFFHSELFLSRYRWVYPKPEKSAPAPLLSCPTATTPQQVKASGAMEPFGEPATWLTGVVLVECVAPLCCFATPGQTGAQLATLVQWVSSALAAAR